MKKVFWFLFFGTLPILLYWPCSAKGRTVASEQPLSLSAEKYDEALQAFIKKVDTDYPFFDLKKIKPSWQKCKRDLKRKVKDCKSNDDFYILLDKARRCLRDAHLGFSGLKGQYPKGPELYYPSVSFLPAINKQIVIMSARDEYAGDLSPGTIVKEINGQDARTLLNNQARADWRQGGYFSSPQRARLFAYRIPLKGPKDQSHQLTILKNGQPKQITIVNKWPAGGWPHTYAMPDNLTRQGNCRYGKLESGYGYIHLRRISSDLIESIDAALKSFGDIEGLIIDLRGNGGGGYSRDIFKRFDKKNKPPTATPYFNGPIVVLIDAGTFSAGETFARDMVHNADAYLMGSNTAGSSTAKKSWDLPHNLGQVRFSTRSRHGLKGRPIEYYGIRPNRKVEVVPEELQSGVNSAIKRADEYLDKKLKKTVVKTKR